MNLKKKYSIVGIRAICRTAVLPSKHCLLILDTSVAELANYQFYTAVDINKRKINYGTPKTYPRTDKVRNQGTQKSSLQAGKHFHITRLVLALFNTFLQGTRALIDVKRAQKKTDNCIRKAPFQRLARDIAKEVRGGKPINFTKSALEALLVASEDHIIESMKYGINLQCDLTKKPTLTPEALKYATFMKPGVPVVSSVFWAQPIPEKEEQPEE